MLNGANRKRRLELREEIIESSTLDVNRMDGAMDRLRDGKRKVSKGKQTERRWRGEPKYRGVRMSDSHLKGRRCSVFLPTTAYV